MLHPEIMRLLAADRAETLRRAAVRPARVHEVARAAETSDVELRLCRVSDDPELERLASLEGRPLPFGRLVVAVVKGKIVAALPVGGGKPLADPFARTEHLMPLLELRAAQLRGSEPRSRFWPRQVRLARSWIGA
jgi:hypothetical protein